MRSKILSSSRSLIFSTRFLNCQHKTMITANKSYSSQPFNSNKKLNNDDPDPPSSQSSRSQVVTLATINKLYEEKVPITMLTAYDFASARMVGMSASRLKSQKSQPKEIIHPGVDVCLVGDSLAMVSLGYSSTTEISFQEFSYHVQAVRRGLDSLKFEESHRIPILVADLPFGSFETSVEDGLRSSIELFRRARVDAVKIEGGSEIVPLVKKLTSFGISVFGHIGLTPQRVSALGGFKVQGHDSKHKALQIISDAVQLQEAGCIGIILEAIPVEVVGQILRRLSIPTIGIGAGPSTDGQVLVLSDLIGQTDSQTPKFVPKFDPEYFKRTVKGSSCPTWEVGLEIINEYVYRVRNRQFPIVSQHTYKMKPEVLKELDESGWKQINNHLNK